MRETDSRGRSDLLMADRLLYREDEGNFKKRLNSAVQIGWFANTILTVIVSVAILWLLGFPIAYGILLGILIALLTNFHYTLIQVTKANRWEVYRNRIVMPKGLNDGKSEVLFEDIDDIVRQRKFLNDLVIIKLRNGRRIRIQAKGQEDALRTLFLAFKHYSNAKSRPRQDEVTIPVVSVE